MDQDYSAAVKLFCRKIYPRINKILLHKKGMKKARTSVRIIKEEGWVALFRKSLQEIRSYGSGIAIDDLGICYQALKAD